MPSGWMGTANAGFTSAVCSANKEPAGFRLVCGLLLSPTTETAFLNDGDSLRGAEGISGVLGVG